MVFQYTKDTQNIVTLTMDMPGRSANVINETFLVALEAALAQLQAEDTLPGVIITSGKPLFLAGADIDALYEAQDPQTLFDFIERYKRRLRQLETLGKPVVAALNGTALGGGWELALACHFRVALDAPKSKFGFPEVTLGLIPGAGGITRLVRMLGLEAAFPYLVEGIELVPQQALKAGLIDALATDQPDLIAQARAWITANPAPKKLWDEKGFKLPGGPPTHPKVAQMLAIAPAMLRKKTRGNYPAPHAIMAAAVEGAQVDFDTASRIESRYLAKCSTGQVAKNMMTAFWYHLNTVKKGNSRPSDVPRQPTQQVGVLGAGFMGHGIAYVSAYAGLDVVLKDVSIEAAEAGKAKIQSLLAERVQRERLTQERADEILNRVQATANAADLARCDLIIEAVFEDRSVKMQVIAGAEAMMESTGVFASNTSTLPITSLAATSTRPEQFIGLHFFSPVHKMKLVEIIVGAQTNDTTLAKAFDYVLKINKVPIVVNDSRGFYTSRVVGTFVQEGFALLNEGQHPQAIEAAAMQAGMPVGPLALSDEVNIGLLDQIRQQTRQDLSVEAQTPERLPYETVLDTMIALGRTGHAQGAGFYAYPPNGGQKHLWPELQAQFAQPSAPTYDQQLMMDRLLFVQALETVRCLDEGVITSVPEANIGSIFGWGFAPFQGGTLQFINAYDLPAFVQRAQTLAERFGGRFAPPLLLVEMAEAGQGF